LKTTTTGGGGDDGDGGDRSDGEAARAKGLANEMLPDPSQAEDDLAAGGPRGRTIDHLKRILAAAGAGLALQGSAVLGAEGSAPSGGAARDKGSDTSGKGSPAADQPPPPPPPPPTLPPEPPGYGVVDPLPPSDRIPRPVPAHPIRTGKLRLMSTPEADIIVDDAPTGKKTPQHLRLPPGVHTITLRAGKLEQTFTVEIVEGKTITEKRDLRPAAGKKTPAAGKPQK